MLGHVEPGKKSGYLLRCEDRSFPLLTTDKVYGELIFRQNLIFAGVLLIRLTGLSQTEKARIVSSITHDHSIE
jgi:hypothetical protein